MNVTKIILTRCRIFHYFSFKMHQIQFRWEGGRMGRNRRGRMGSRRRGMEEKGGEGEGWFLVLRGGSMPLFKSFLNLGNRSFSIDLGLNEMQLPLSLKMDASWHQWRGAKLIALDQHTKLRLLSFQPHSIVLIVYRWVHIRNLIVSPLGGFQMTSATRSQLGILLLLSKPTSCNVCIRILSLSDISP